MDEFMDLLDLGKLGLGGAAGMAMGLMIFLVILVIVVSLLCIAFYVFHSLVLYKFAKKRGIAYAWMAWIPYVSSYVIGELAGPMRLFGRCEIRQTGLWVALAPIIAIGAGDLINGFALIPVLGVMFGVLAVIVKVVGIIAAILFTCLALYRVYSCYLPKNTTLTFAILSILIVTIPFFLLSVMNKPQIGEGYDFTV